jgi:protein tyrosine/serine phosphatase
LSKDKLHPRHLVWEGTINARDSGGLPADGGSVREGALVRSDELSDLTPDGVQELIDHGVRTVIDVRSADEIADAWDRYPFRQHDIVEYRNLPFRTARDEASTAELRAAWDRAQTRHEFNAIDLDYNARGMGAIVAAIADAPPGGVLIHCHAGKDRTGMVIALALSAVGVSDEDIAADYALTELVLDEIMAEWFGYIGVTDDTEKARLWDMSVPSREAMLDTLAYLRERYGGAERYLLDAGVTSEQLERLRARLVDAKKEEAA